MARWERLFDRARANPQGSGGLFLRPAEQVAADDNGAVIGRQGGQRGGDCGSRGGGFGNGTGCRNA